MEMDDNDDNEASQQTADEGKSRNQRYDRHY